MGQYEFPNPEWAEVSQEGENPGFVKTSQTISPAIYDMISVMDVFWFASWNKKVITFCSFSLGIFYYEQQRKLLLKYSI